jgi:hypothetical protein
MTKKLSFIAVIGFALSLSACSEELIEILEELHHHHHHHDTDQDQDTEYCEVCYENEDGTVTCEVVPCEGGCYFDGVYYEEAEKFTAPDGCNTCICEGDGMVSCTEMACPEGCYIDGKMYLVGEIFEDGCTTCICEAPGIVSCRTPEGEECGRDTSCDDGSVVMCDMMPPQCDERFEILAVQNNCYRCVNPATCKPWGQPGCDYEHECPPTMVCDPCATSSCPMCDDCVSACVEVTRDL